MANKKDGTAKKVVGGVALGLVLVLAGGVCGGLLQRHFNWGEDPAVETPTDEETPEGGSSEIETAEERGVKMSVRKLSTSEFAAYGVSALAEDAYTLTATVLPADASNKALDWSVSFVNASSSWAKGKTVTDYVTVTPTSDGALTATVENLGAFGEQIQVRATSRNNPDAYATCTVDYLQKTTSYGFSVDGEELSADGAENLITLTFSENKSAEAEIVLHKSTVYTIENDEAAENMYFEITPLLAFGGVVDSSGGQSSNLKTYSGTGSATLTGFFDKTWGEALYGSDNAIKNALITNIPTYTGADAYEVKIYDEEGGTQIWRYGIRFDTSVIVGQKGVESISLDETGIVF